MSTEMKRIFLDTKEKAPIARLFKCTAQHVNSALRGDKDSELVMRIRMEALKRGGFYIPKRIQLKEWQETPEMNSEKQIKQ
jgi:hypothetical protein